MAKTWLIASGKGGVGKSTVTACLGMALARMGRRVCIVDADIGLRDQDALLGLENRIVYDLVDVAHKDCLLSEALISPDDESGLSLLPASQFARVKELEPKAFRRILSELRIIFDFILIDCPAGVERGLRGLMSEEINETLLVCTPDDICIRNAERAMAVMEKKGLPRPQLIMNRLQPDLIRAGEMYSAQVAAATLDVSVLGEVPEDSCVYRAALKHLSPMNVECEAQHAFTRIARRMAGYDIPLPAYGSDKLPWYKRIFRPKLKEVTPIDH